MKTFNGFVLSEVNLSLDDIFKRDNRQRFIQLATSGKLINDKEETLPALDKNDSLIKHLESNYLKTKELSGLMKSSFGKTLGGLKIDKGANGFSGGRGSSPEPSGAEWEEIICCAYNMLAHKIDQGSAISKAGITGWKDKFDDYLPKGIEIVKNTFGDSPNNTMEHYGAGNSPLTKGWDKFFIDATGKSAPSPTRTPKTDMYIGKQHISLKKQGGSQLMSGGKAETLATLSFAYASVSDKVKTKKLDDAWDKLTKQIKTDFTKVKLPPSQTITKIKKDIKKEKKSKLLTLVKDSLKQNDLMTNAIRSILETPEVNRAVVREAMTGENKFKDSLPVSTHMMIFNSGGFGEYKAIDNKLVYHFDSERGLNVMHTFQ